jgi:hypothetical protein
VVFLELIEKQVIQAEKDKEAFKYIKEKKEKMVRKRGFYIHSGDSRRRRIW